MAQGSIGVANLHYLNDGKCYVYTVDYDNGDGTLNGWWYQRGELGSLSVQIADGVPYDQIGDDFIAAGTDGTLHSGACCCT